MLKSQSDKLVSLINSLTKAEKRSFKLFVKRNGNDGDTKFMQLFQLISKDKYFDEASALKKIPDLKKTQVSNLKANLFKQILSCLRLLERNKIAELQVREQIDFARILYDKGMYKTCLEILDKAKKQSREINFETLTLSILYFEKQIESQHVTGSMSIKADELSSESNTILKQIDLTNQLSNLSLLLYGRFLRIGFVKNDSEYEELKSFFDKNIPVYKEQDLKFYQKLYLYQSYVWFHYMAQDFINCYKYSRKWVNLYEVNPVRKITSTTPYIKGYHNLLNALFMTKSRDRFNDAYSQFLDFDIHKNKIPSFNEVSLFQLFKWTHFLNNIFLNGEYEVSDELEELGRILKENQYGWDQHRTLILNYKLGCCYFGIGDLDKAIDYLNNICNQNYPDFRQDIQSFARILNLISNFDKGNETLVNYQVKSLYRFLSKMKELEQTQIEIIKFLRKTPKMFPKDMNFEFIKLKDELSKIEARPYEKRPFLYLDIISWLEAKIEGVSIKNIIAKKLAV